MMMNRVWVRDDNTVIAVHGAADPVPDDAYGDRCTVILAPEGAIRVVTTVRDDEAGTETILPTVLPADWRETYRSPVPERVTKLGLRRALREGGKTQAFDAALAKVDATVREDWEIGTAFRSDDPALAALLSEMKLRAEARDDLLRRAEALG